MTRPGHGDPTLWCTLGSRYSGQQVSSDRHERVEVKDSDFGTLVRCHDCGALARASYRRLVVLTALTHDDPPLDRALLRLDRECCQPIHAGGQLCLI